MNLDILARDSSVHRPSDGYLPTHAPLTLRQVILDARDTAVAFSRASTTTGDHTETTYGRLRPERRARAAPAPQTWETPPPAPVAPIISCLIPPTHQLPANYAVNLTGSG